MRSLIVLAAVAGALVTAVACSADTAALTAQKPIVIPGGPGRFDYMLVDKKTNRLYATHKGTKSLAILDLSTRQPLPSPAVGTTQGIAVDTASNTILLGAEEGKIVVLNGTTLKIEREIATSGPVDDIVFLPQAGRLYADHDDGGEVWAIDLAAGKVASTIAVPGPPEFIEYDKKTGRLYQNMKSDNSVQVIDAATDKVVATWKTAPATGPHGLAIDHKRGHVFSAGSNGKLVEFDMATGNQIAVADIAPGVDQIAFDKSNRRIYCACAGYISVVEETPDGLKALGNVPAPKGSHTLAVDPTTHSVWTTGFDGKDSYFVEMTPQ